MQSNNFKIKFEGQQNQIDANVLISSLIHTSSLIQEINNYLETGKQIDIKIKALEKGSFLIDFHLIETSIEALKHLFTKENLEICGVVISTMVGLIELRKFLKGENPKSIEEGTSSTTIINNNGTTHISTNIVYKIYSNSPIAKEAISKNFEAINNDLSIDGFSIIENDVTLLNIEKNEFDSLIIQDEEIDEDEKTKVVIATLNIIKPSFDNGLQWEFLYLGNRIKAKIKDVDFQNRIDNGEQFAKGNTLVVHLQILQKFDPSLDNYVNKSYMVLKIIEHLSRWEQKKLNFDEE